MTATASNQATSRRTTLSRAYRDGLAEEMARDPSILVMGTDLYERGLDKKVLVVVAGEFGRTPRISYVASSGGGVAGPKPAALAASSTSSCLGVLER